VNVDVDAGQYGYQFIDPPTALSSLLNQELMENEWESLRPWRELRTKDRMWDYPLQSPLENTPSISADYGDRRSYGGMFEGYHSGIDYRASRGTPVVAPTAGRVVFVDRLEARGNAVLVDHGWGLVTGYWHLSAINVRVGDQVAGGEILGWVGNTGLSTGSHLHWELWVNGVAVDGRQWLAGEGLLVSLPQPMDFSFQDGFVGSPIPEPY
jgi:murein DD-endopeptidase MepM/ murein hydrolase activator NlpD